MAEYMTLLGSEEVGSAGRNISAAADRIASAASTIDEAARRLGNILDDTTTALNRLAEALEKAMPAGQECEPWKCQRGYGPGCADAPVCEKAGGCSDGDDDLVFDNKGKRIL